VAHFCDQAGSLGGACGVTLALSGLILAKALFKNTYLTGVIAAVDTAQTHTQIIAFIFNLYVLLF
jgi:hypothetical protein